MELAHSLSFADGQSPDVDALILWHEGTLRCFSLTERATFSVMTRQEGYSEVPLSFKPATIETCARCLRSVLEGIALKPFPRIALVMTSPPEWSSELLPGLEEQLCTKGRTFRFTELSLQTFLWAARQPVPVGEPLKWRPPSQSASERARKPPCARTSLELSRGPAEQSSDSPEWIVFDDANDVPIDLARVLWKVRTVPETADFLTRVAIENLASMRRCFSTEDASQLLTHGDTGSIAGLVRTYKTLRLWEGRHTFVPMVGFRQGSLYAESFLKPYSQESGVCVTLEELHAFQKYIVNCPPLVPNRNTSPLAQAAHRCLRSSTGSLRLFDLTEDVITDLTGRSKFHLSLSDVLRLVLCLRAGGIAVGP